MAQLTPDVTYERLKRIADWQLIEEAQRSALAELVGAITGLDTSSHWGEGRNAASDGQRFSLPHRVLQQTYSTRFSDFALEALHLCCRQLRAVLQPAHRVYPDCDAAFVLDGLLYNESELEIEEHYTDTHGYTELNFAAFGMLGLRFCPRIRGVQHQRIYRIDSALRVIASGAKSFVWEGRVNGRVRRITIGQFPDMPVAVANRGAEQ